MYVVGGSEGGVRIGGKGRRENGYARRIPGGLEIKVDPWLKKILKKNIF